jgi:hypothetical protein
VNRKFRKVIQILYLCQLSYIIDGTEIRKLIYCRKILYYQSTSLLTTFQRNFVIKVTHHWRGAIYRAIIMNRRFFFRTKISRVSQVLFDGFLMNNIFGKPLIYREMELAFVSSLKFAWPLCRFYWRELKYGRAFGVTTVKLNLMKIGHQGPYVHVWIWISRGAYGYPELSHIVPSKISSLFDKFLIHVNNSGALTVVFVHPPLIDPGENWTAVHRTKLGLTFFGIAWGQNKRISAN